MPKKKQAAKWPNRDEWMTIPEAVTFTNGHLPNSIHRATVYRWIKQGKLEAVTAAGHQYISRSCLEDFLKPVSV
jgi:excisionase family DNA binding protein